jgi:hypothetical protein
LAATYAAEIPQDQAVRGVIATAADMSPAQAGRDLTITVENGSALLDVRFTAPVRADVAAGLTALTDAVTGPDPLSAAIAGGTLVLVRPPDATVNSSMSPRRTVPLGALLGLVIASVVAVAWERSDPRVDDVDDLRAELACPCWPAASNLGAAAAASIVAAWRARADVWCLSVAFIPVGHADPSAESKLREAIQGAAGPGGILVRDVNLETGTHDEALTGSEDLAVLIVKRGSRLEELRTTVGRLEELGRSPAWAFLLRSRGHSSSGPTSPAHGRSHIGDEPSLREAGPAGLGRPGEPARPGSAAEPKPRVPGLGANKATESPADTRL